eukprot:TRINITY_DN285_c2_g1_i1.p1 TRINITY_DN285_c2_g1~~TRINITY_DN285_c2_g1_i1.p1  ORF type:complete len:327 (+),score=84.88 TRINITY_DN285_c2_g1_i1:60-983(+)
MTTAAGFSFCHASNDGVEEVEPKWRTLCEDAVAAHRVMQALCERVSVISGSVTQFKTAVETVPKMCKSLDEVSQVIEGITEKVLQVEKIATLLEVEKSRAQHLQRTVAYQKQVKKHISDNKKELAMQEDGLKQAFFDRKKEDRLKTMKLKTSFGNISETSSGAAKQEQQQQEPVQKPEENGPAEENSAMEEVATPAAATKKVEEVSQEIVQEEEQQQPAGITCTFCSYHIPEGEEICEMCDEPASPLKDEGGGGQEEIPVESNTSSNSPAVLSASVTEPTTTTTEGIDIPFPSPSASLPPTEGEISE